MSGDKDFPLTSSDWFQKVSSDLNEGKADRHENGELSQIKGLFGSHGSEVASEWVQKTIDGEDTICKSKCEKVLKAIKEGFTREFVHNDDNDIETHMRDLENECIFQCKSNDLAYNALTDHQKVFLLMDKFSQDVRQEMKGLCEQSGSCIDTISYSEFFKLAIEQYGTKKSLIHIVLQYFDDTRLLQEKDSPMFIHNVKFMNNLDPCMQPDSAAECRKFVDLIQMTAYYASLRDPEVKRALLKIPEEQATLMKFMDVALQETLPITSHSTIQVTLGLTTDTEIENTSCDIGQSSDPCSENNEDISNNDNQNHIKTHNEEFSNEFSHGMTETVSKYHEFESHINVHIGKRPYQCSMCDKGFLKSGDLNRHMVVHTGERPHQCGQCGKAFAYKVVLKRHMALHTGEVQEKTHKCNLCEKAFICNSHLTKHMRDHTGERPHKCSKCDKTFKLKSHLREHYRVHTGKAYYCNECDQSFTRPTSLKNHMLRHAPGYTEERSCICSVCGKAFKSISEVNRHMVIHSGERPYECSQCGKDFPFKSSLKLHMLTHTGEGQRPHQCGQCDKSFSTNSLLLIHMRNHTGEKPYKCNQCDKAFQVKRSLTDHMLTHTGDGKKPYQCSQCDKSFSGNSLLLIHMRNHTGERPFKCSQCDKDFQVKRSLTDHMLTHTGDGKKPYQCSQCDKTFLSNSLLLIHMRNHTGEKPFKCTECNKAFQVKRSYADHMKLHTDTNQLNMVHFMDS